MRLSTHARILAQGYIVDAEATAKRLEELVDFATGFDWMIPQNSGLISKELERIHRDFPDADEVMRNLTEKLNAKGW